MEYEWKPPGFMQKVSGFLVAYADWVAAGFPRRSPEWVKEIFETHCKPCEWYDANAKTVFGKQGMCTRCGCHVSADFDDMQNKIVLPNTSCPLDEPKWKANIQCKNEPRTERAEP